MAVKNTSLREKQTFIQKLCQKNKAREIEDWQPTNGLDELIMVLDSFTTNEIFSVSKKDCFDYAKKRATDKQLRARIFKVRKETAVKIFNQWGK